MSPLGVLTPLYLFPSYTNYCPYGGLTWGNDGNLYGTTSESVSYPNTYGRIFTITTNGNLSVLATFKGTNGSQPLAPLTLGSDGNFYGTTSQGGANSLGTVFKVTTNGTLTSLVSFGGTNGCTPAYGALIQAGDGNFYGTTLYGGSNYSGGVFTGNGTVFRVDTNGNLTTLIYFNGTNGAIPSLGLTIGIDQNFYGTTQVGGTSNLGTVFKMSADGTLNTLFSFTGTNGKWPDTLLAQDADGFLYGTTAYSILDNGTSTNGTVFKVTTNGVLTTLFHFDGTNGINPLSYLILGKDGNIYGTLSDINNSGSPDGSYGSIFRLYAPPIPAGYNQITGQLLDSGDVQLSFVGGAGTNYALDYATSLSPTNWLPQATNPADGNGNLIFTNTPDATTKNFWRIRSVP